MRFSTATATVATADLVRLLKKAFVAGGKDGKYRATALVYDVRVKLPAADTNSDAIAVDLDHEDGYSIVVYLPYKLEDSKVVMGEPLAQDGAHEIFG